VNEPKAVFRRISDCETESWRDDVTGHVDWWTLFSADRTPTSELTVGIADVPVGAPRPARGHTHAQSEVYVFLSGHGEVVIEGVSTAVTAGDAVFIPGGIEHMAVNTGNEVLRLLYFFAADSFADIKYEFPGHV
jgi:mannose-6-phosphate isomerase-like protein (cupin superfamily)